MKHALAAALILCAPAASAGAPPIDWENLRNPVLGYDDQSIKDFAAAYHDGRYHVFFSSFHESRGEVRSHVVHVTTTDWREFSEPHFMIDGAEEGWTGYCAPEIAEHDGVYYLTFNSWGKRHPNGRTNDLFFKSTRDFVEWSEIKPLAPELTQDKTCIDVTLYPAAGRWYLFFKDDYLDHDELRFKRTRLAVADDVDGPYEWVGSGYVNLLEDEWRECGQSHENYSFARHGGKHWLLTSDYSGGRPRVLRLRSNAATGEAPIDFLTWRFESVIPVPREGWNTHDVANAATILDMTAHDGYFYLLYAGSSRYHPDGNGFIGRGWNRLALMRSKDLVEWESPGGGAGD